MVTWQEFKNKEGFGENYKESHWQRLWKLSNKAIINEIVINNLYRTLNPAQYKVKEYCKQVKRYVIACTFYQSYELLFSMLYMFYSAISTFRTIITVHCSAEKQKFTVHCSKYLLADGPIPLNGKFTVYCSLMPVGRWSQYRPTKKMSH